MSLLPSPPVQTPGMGQRLSERLFFEAERKAEQTIGVFRIVIAAGIAIPLFLAVEAVGGAPPEEATRRQIGMAFATITAYAVLGAFTVYRARRGNFRWWMPWASSTADVGFFLFNLAFNLSNTKVAAGYIAMLPAVWLVPIVLAFGVMRYRPLLQAYQLALIILGGGAVVAAYGTPGYGPDAPIAETLPHLAHVPPQVVRVSMLMSAGAVLILAAMRRRALLQQAVNEAEHARNLSRYLPPQFADFLAREDDLERLRNGIRLQASVMFVDIRGFTGLSETLDEGALSRFVTEYRQRLTGLVHAHGGVVDKFVGDGALIVFGLPEPAADDAARALACATGIVEEIERWSGVREAAGEAAVRVGIGLHCGEVYAGVVGDNSRLEATVLGDTVNVASRLETMTKAEGVPLLVSGAVLETARLPETVEARTIRSVPIRGRRAPMEVVAITPRGTDQMQRPPSTSRQTPVRNSASSEQR